MATIPQSPNTPPPPSSPDTEPLKGFVDDPDADLVLRSCDSQEFRVLKLFVIKNSPVLDKQIQASSESPQAAISTNTHSPLPVVQLPDTGVILSALLTFIFPVATVLPPTLEEIMQLLSVAQKYEMASVLSHIRNCVASKDPPFICPENAFYAYTLAQKFGLRQEVAKAARLTLTFTLTIENLDDKLNVMPGAYLYELWKYHKSVKRNLKSHVEDFIRSCADNTFLGQICVSLSPRGIPRWLDDYLTSIATYPSSFNPIDFHKTLADHTLGKSSTWISFLRNSCASCSKIPNEDINTLWTALTNFVNENIAKVSVYEYELLRSI
jgi:BTB/POZ domain